MVENRGYSRYQNGMFEEGGREEHDQHFTRKWTIYDHKETGSKIILLFKVDSRNLKAFLQGKIGRK